MASSGYVVHWDVVKEYGQVVAQQESALGGVRSALGGVHVPSNAFGMLPEAQDLYQAYTQHAGECQEIMAKLPEQIGEVAQALYGAAGSYSDAEEQLAEEIEEDLGKGAAGGASGGGAPAVFSALMSRTAQAYAWTEGSSTDLPAAKAPAEGQKGLEGMLDEAVNWVMEHTGLMKYLNDVTGDTGALISAANVWAEQGNRINGVIRALREGAAGLPDQWAGEAAAASGSFMKSVTEGLSQLVTVMGQTEKILEEAAKEAGQAHDLIVGIIGDVVEWVVGNILVDAATLGLASAFEAAGTAAFLAREAEEAEKVSVTLAKALRELEQIVQAMEKLKTGVKDAEGLGKLTKFLKVGTDLKKAMRGVKAAKDAPMLEKAANFGVRYGVIRGLRELSPESIGVKGGLIHTGISVGKDVLGSQPVKDLVGQTPSEVKHDASQVGSDVQNGNPGQAVTDARHDASQIQQNVQQTDMPKAESDLHKDGVQAETQLGVRPTPVPQAPPASRIEAMLNGQDAD